MSKALSVWAVVLTCGKSEQVAPDVQTAFLQMGDQPVLSYSLNAFNECADIEGIVVTAPKDRLDAIVGMSRLYGYPKLKKLVACSSQRIASVRTAVAAIADAAPDMIVIHEASRPGVTAAMISETIKAAKRHGSAAIAENIHGPMVLVKKGQKSHKYFNDNSLWLMQSPLAMKIEAVHRLVGSPKSKVKPPTMDDASFLERLYRNVRLVPAQQPNPRIATATDIRVVAALMNA